MVDITFTFTPVSIKSEQKFKPACKMAQMYCLLNDVDAITKQQLDDIRHKGYKVVVTSQV